MPDNSESLEAVVGNHRNVVCLEVEQVDKRKREFVEKKRREKSEKLSRNQTDIGRPGT
jgi:hypothetical protein